MNLVVDMNLSPRWVSVLVQAGFLAATYGQKPSVVQIRAEDVSPDAIARQIVAALRQMATELEQGALLTVDANRTRLRLLPFAH
jgi:predicted nuclease of predicted toxin-antitoxin system